MPTYGQFCPIARASEILAERWTPIILRNLLYGCTTFSDLASGAPGISRTLLSKRLQQLDRAGVIEIRPKPDGNGSVYELTQAGRELWRVLQALGDWGTRWLELAPASASPDVVLWSWCTAYLERELLPKRRVLVRFEFPGQPAHRQRLWLLVDNRDAEVCHGHPGFEEDLVVVVENPETLARWHLGLVEWAEAVRAGHVRVIGPRHLARALPTWNRRRTPAQRDPGTTTAGVQSLPASRSPSTVIPAFAGHVLRPGDAGYDKARAVWNGAVDRRPAYIARCTSPDDVVAALRFARHRELLLSVRGGGHGVAGTAVCDDGVVIDMSAMKGIHVEPGLRSARAAAGVLWGELDASTQAFGLATTGGVVSHTGIAGLTLGGGIGWLMRRFDLTVDNLLSAEVVTTEGGLVTASQHDHPDLFWGLRGGGGTLGIVTSFTYRLHTVGPRVLAGPVLWPLEDGPQVLRSYRDYVASAPREVATVVTLRKAPPLSALPVELQRRPVCMITMCYVGAPDAGERALAPLRGVGRPLLDLVEQRPYTDLQSMVDATVLHGWHYYWKSTNLGPLEDDVIDTMVDHASRIDSPWSYAVVFHLGGAVGEVEEQATAYCHRRAEHNLNINATWLPHQRGEAEVAWARNFFTALQPHHESVYLNFLDHDDGHRADAAYDTATHRRLATLQRRWDPAGLLRGDHNMHGAAATSR